MKLAIPSVSVKSSPQEIALAIENSRSGVLTMTGFPTAPFDEILKTFDQLSQDKILIDRLNKAYPKNLVYKDAFANGKGGDDIDMKRVLDLSPDRLETMKKNDAALVETVQQQGSLSNNKDRCPRPWTFGSACALNSLPRLSRLWPEPPDQRMLKPMRHSTIAWWTTMSEAARLQLLVVANIGTLGPLHSIRSNGRIPAVLHRVTHDKNTRIPRRASAVLFCAPKQPDTPLEPVVGPGETANYIGGIRAGQLRGAMARKWQMREGTIRPQDLIQEEAEILATNMRTQDDVVQQTVAAVSS